MLYSNDTDKVYIGSTIKEPGQRYNEHIYNPEHTSARQLLNMSKDVNFKILEVLQFSDISELRKREMTYINSNDKCVNIVKSYTSQEEKKINLNPNFSWSLKICFVPTLFVCHKLS